MTDAPRLSDEQLAQFRKACQHKFLVDLGGEIRLGRGEFQALLDEVEAYRSFMRLAKALTQANT